MTNHRIIEHWSWKGCYKAMNPTPCSMQNTSQSSSDRWLSNFLLNASSVGALPTAWGNCFHYHAALPVKKFFPDIQPKSGCSMSPLLPRLHSGMIKSRFSLLLMTAFPVFEKCSHNVSQRNNCFKIYCWERHCFTFSYARFLQHMQLYS